MHPYISMSLLHPLWGKVSTLLAVSFTNVCWQNVYVSNTTAVHESKKSQQIHKGSDLFLKPTLFGQLILQFLPVRNPHAFQSAYHEWNKSSSRRKPAGEQLRKEMLHSESVFSASNSLGSRQKMKSCLIANTSLIPLSRARRTNQWLMKP